VGHSLGFVPFTDNQGPRFSAANFAKFHAQFVKFHKIPRHYYLQIPYVQWPVGVVLTDSTSECKEFIETRNTKTHYIVFVHICVTHSYHVIRVTVLIVIVELSLQRLDFIVL